MASENLPYEIILRVSEDYYSAVLTVRRKEECVVSDLYEAILAQLQRQNISYGILFDRLNNALASNDDISDVIIAQGIRHLNGCDAFLTNHVNFEGKSKPIIQEDGTVDFKNLLQISAVKQGDVLITKTPVQEGIDGITVTNKTIKPRIGKDIVLKFGENIKLSDDGCQLIATSDGIAKLINGRVTVLQLMETSEVGPESGNVYFGGDVHVKENVLDGYTIHCDGDLTIDGLVEGCILKVKGNLTVGKGILGHGISDIVVGGNLITKFIENANVYVKGELETGEIINSTVLCDSKITVKGKKGLIIGGEITSKYMIEANHIGSRLGVLTSINLGIDGSVIQELKALKELIQELKILEARLKARIPVLAYNALMQPEIEIHQDILHQYQESLMGTQIDLEEKMQRYDHLMDALKNVSQGRVKINSIFPDTIIRIGNSKYFVDKVLSACIITRADDQVIAIGIEK